MFAMRQPYVFYTVVEVSYTNNLSDSPPSQQKRGQNIQ